MFEKFGRMKSVQELNDTAKGFLEERDEDSLFALAQENGIEEDDAADYLDGVVPEFVTPTMAAIGRITIYKKELLNGKKDLAMHMAMRAILNMIQTMVSEPEMAEAIMKNDRTPENIYTEMREEAGKHVSGTGSSRMAVACGTDDELKEIIRTFYLKPNTLRKKLSSLYVMDGGAK